MNGLMDGWMDVTKNTEAHEQGPEQELDACLITVSLCFLFFLVSVFWPCSKFLSSFTDGKKKGFSEHLADMKTVRYCFVTFFLHFLLKLPSLPHPRSLWSHFKAVGTTQSPFSLCFFFFIIIRLSTVCWRGEKNKMMSEWKLALWLCFTRISVKHLHHSQSLYKQLSPYSFQPKTVERYCERSTGTKTGAAVGKEYKCINTEWTGAVMKHRRVTLTLKDLNSHIQSQ